MKKIVALFYLIICLMFCSCTENTSGYSYELTSSNWKTTLNGGAEVSLTFDDDTANLTIINADKSTQIKGKFLADEETFVIFVPEISQNYGFSYIPKGSTLDITYNGNTITLEKTSENQRNQ